MRPILWGMATHALPAIVTIDIVWFMRLCVFVWGVVGVCLKRGEKNRRERGKEETKRIRRLTASSQAKVIERSLSEIQWSKMHALAKRMGTFKMCSGKKKEILSFCNSKYFPLEKLRLTPMYSPSVSPYLKLLQYHIPKLALIITFAEQQKS